MKTPLFLALSLFSLSVLAKPQLPQATNGQEAVNRHRPNMGKIAQKYGKSQEAFEKMLKSTPSSHMTDDEKLFISDETLLNFVGDEDPVLNPIAAQIPDSAALQLHSRPGAAKTILLDFTGHVTANTSWNYNGNINSLPFDTDGNPTTAFTADELNRIKDIWLRVAEDYAPFNVDVTTEDSASVNGIRVVISPTWEWYGQAGGVAFIDSASWNDGTPCFVFSGLLGNNMKNVAEAASHEAGHAFGLYHQAKYDANGVKTSDYHSGLGAGNYGWAPIMGVGYYKTKVTWHDGPNSYGATNYQDDVQILKQKFQMINDDAPNTIASNSFRRVKFTSDANGQVYKHQGTIAVRGDVDVYRIYAGNGPLNVLVAGATTASNVDLKVKLVDPQGQTVFEADPEGIQSVSISLPSVAEGIYHLVITPMGFTDATGALIYTDYGTLGRYYISGNSAPYTLSIPNDTYNSGPNAIPTVNAGVDKTITLPVNSVVINGSASDSDGSISSVTWTQVSGPSVATLSGANTVTLSASTLVQGTYVFRLTATDNSGGSKSDDVSVFVKPVAPNVAPTVNAGADKTVKLPATSVLLTGTASDSDGSIAEVTWSQVSGPSTAGIASASSLSTNVTNLVVGRYIFKLTVRDNSGATASDSITVNVKRK